MRLVLCAQVKATMEKLCASNMTERDAGSKAGSKKFLKAVTTRREMRRRT
jgi:hypothetical protein